jgi:hypothetical protein
MCHHTHLESSIFIPENKSLGRICRTQVKQLVTTGKPMAKEYI